MMMSNSIDDMDDCGEDDLRSCLGLTHHHTLGSNPLGGST